jgi:hypothetical protein
MPSNTTNLALYKKNPATDGADTFNIDTMLNENWDKIDTAVAQANKITAKSASATLTATEQGIVEVTTGSSVITITLPSAATSGLRYTIKKVDAGSGTVTVATTSGQVIDGATTKTINARYVSLTVVSNGTGWDIVIDGVLNPWGDNTRSCVLSATNAAQALSAGVATKVTWGSTNRDNLTEFSTSRFTAKHAGLYHMTGTISLSGMTGGSTSLNIVLYVNGVGIHTLAIVTPNVASLLVPFSDIFTLNVGDYAEIYITSNNTGATIGSGSLMNLVQEA